MNSSSKEGLQLTEEEAFALLHLAMTSSQRLDVTSEKALKKLAEYCSTSTHFCTNEQARIRRVELSKAGA
jgi:endonuclease III